MSVRRRAAVVSAVLAAAAAVFVLLIHLPVVRRAALRYAVPVVERQYGIRLDADRLDYNVAALRIGLAGVRLSAPATPREPFFTADYVSVTLAASSLAGPLSFRDIGATRAQVFIRRQPDGTINLPAASDRPTTEPPPLRVDRLDIPQLSIDLRDEQAVRFLWIPSMAVLLTHDDGYVKFARPAQVNTETQVSSISELAGKASFDGRALHFADLRVKAEEGSAQLDGSLTLLAREQALDVRVRGTADATRLARWVVLNGDLPRGELGFEAQAAGPFTSLDTRLRVTSGRLAWQNLIATEMAGRMRISAVAADIESLQFGFEGGRIDITGTLPLAADGKGRATGRWEKVNTASAVASLLPDTAWVPAGVMAGRLEAQGTGTDPARWSGTLETNVAPGRNARGRVAVSGHIGAGLRDGGWRIEGRTTVGGVAPLTLALGGRIDDSAVRGTVHLGVTQVPALLDVLRVTGIASIEPDTVTAGTIEGDARMAGTLDDPEVRFDLGAPDLVVEGQRFVDSQFVGRLTRSELMIEASSRQPGGTGRVSATALYGIPTGRYTATAEASQWQLVATDEQPFAGNVSLEFAGEGERDLLRGTGHVAVDDGRWREVMLGRVDASVTLDGRAAAIDARAPAFAATAQARVQLDAPYHAIVDARADGLDLAQFLQSIDTPTPLAGVTTASLHAEGPLQAWRDGAATVTVASLEATAGELPIRLVDAARLRYDTGRVRVERLEAAAGETRISVSGELPVFEPATGDASGVIATVTGDIGEVARAAAAAGLTQLPVTGGDGPVALLARVTGTVESPVLAADLEIGPGSITVERFPAVNDVRVRAHAEDGWVELREGAASYADATLSATGKAPLTPGTGDRADVHVTAKNLTAAILAPFLDPGTVEQLAGTVDATLDASASSMALADVTGELRLDRLDLRIADLPVSQRTPTRIVARDGFARIEAWEWTGQGATLALRGQVRLDDRQAAILANGVVDLRVLTPFVRTAGMATSGRLEPRLSVTGALDNPRIDGDLTLTDGEIRLADPRVLVSDLAGRTVLTGTSARIVSLTGTINGGMLTGSGEIDYVVGQAPGSGVDESASGPAVQGRLAAGIRGMALEFPEGLRSEIDGDLTLEFARAMGSLSGTVTVVRSAYREPLALVGGLLATARARRLDVTESSRALEALALNLRVITDEDLIVDNNYARAQLGADVRIIGTAAAPGMSGRADIREGGQLFVGRNVYTVNVGSIDFVNPVAIEPILNVEAATRAGGEDIEVTIAGPAESPTVDLRSPSNPDLGQAELTSLLLTGRRLEDLAPGDAAFVGTQVLGNFSAEVLGFASRAVGLDTLRLGGVEGAAVRRDPTAVATELDPTTRLTFGKSLGSDVDLTFSQSLRNSDAQTWIVDYAPRRGLELRLVSDDDDLRSYGFRHDLALGSSSRTGASAGVRRQRPIVRVASVAVTGELAMPEPRVRGVLRLKAGDRFDFGAWQDDRERLERLYRQEGHFVAHITPRRADGPDGVALTYEIAAGPETRIEVTGIDVDRSLRADLETAWFEAVFDEFLIAEATQIVRGRLAGQGYRAPAVDVRVVGSGASKTLMIAVDRGIHSDPETAAPKPEAAPPPVISTVTFDGAQSLPDAGLRAAVGLDVASPYDPAAVDGARRRLVALYRREGFATAAVTVRPRIDPDTRTIDVAFVVAEGPRQLLGEVAIAGNRAIHSDVVIRSLGLEVGAPLRAEDVLRARSRVFNTGLFRRIDIASEPIDGEHMRLRVTVEEWPAARLRYGFVVAEERPEDDLNGRELVPGISADLTRRTLFGRAMTIGTAVNWQRRERRGRAFLNVPTFMALPVESSLIGERSREEFEAVTLVTDRTSLTWEQRTRVARTLNLSYSYTFERDHTFDTRPAEPGSLAFDITVNIARVNAAAAWDTRDDPANATRGSLASYNFEFAPEAVGSDISFIRHLGQAYYFRSWRDVVLASAARAGVVVPLGGQDLILSERFFAGGSRTVRGVSEGSLGPSDFFGVTGGRLMAVFNEEARVPIYKWVRGVAFIDAGNVFDRPAEASLRDLVGSAGIGLRLATPFALLRADYARTVWGLQESSGRWTFGIGHAF